MLKITEIAHILIAIFVLAFVNSFSPEYYSIAVFLISFLFVTVVVLLNIAAKKITAHYLESAIDIKTWSFQQYWFTSGFRFKKPVPIGIILPFLLSILSLGAVKWFGILQFDVEPLKHKVSKRHGFYSFSDMTDFHIALIAAAGVVINIIVAIIFYLFNLEELARVSVYFACFNMVPLGNLDGSKMFFGSIRLWAGLAIVCIIFLAYVFLFGSVI